MTSLVWRMEPGSLLAAHLLALAALAAVGPAGAEPTPVTVVSAGRDRITFSWRTPEPTTGTLLVGQHPNDTALARSDEEWMGDVEWRPLKVDQPASFHRVQVTGLKPSTRYAYRVVPGQGDPSHIGVTATLPGAARTTYVSLPILVVVYTPIAYQDLPAGSSLQPGVSPRLTESDLKQLREEMARVRGFYWRNSGAALDLDFHFAMLDEVLKDEDDVEPRFEKDVETAAASLGRKVEDYSGVIFLYGWDDALSPEKRRAIYRGAAFGGLTYGTDAPWKYKKTPHSWIHFTRGADVTWTVVHEYHHQLDSLFEASGYPEYFFNHPDPSSPHGRFGEHYDVNAWILRSWPRQKWMGLSFGYLRVATDTDEDGLPDRAPVALDEVRFGSDPASKDTDADGLPDLQEAMAFAGVTAGLDEAMGGPVVLPNPRKADTDGDGTPDGRDPYPLYAANPERPGGAPRWAEPLQSGGWRPFVSMRNADVTADTYLNWDEGHLYFALRSSRPVTLHLDLDAANDGWFHGSDNYRIRVSPKELSGEGVPVDVAIFDWDKFFATPQVYVYWNREKVTVQQLRLAEEREGKWYVLKVAVPRSEATSLRLAPGRRMGIKPSISWPGRPRERQQLTFFAPHELFELRLTSP